MSDILGSRPLIRASLNVREAARRFGTTDPIPPAMQRRGRKVGIFDPSGALWHVTEAPS